MFTALDSRNDSCEAFLDAVQLLVPHTKFELAVACQGLRWRGQFATANRLVWSQLESEIGATCWPKREEERFCLMFPAAGLLGAEIRGTSVVTDSRRALLLGVPDVAKVWTDPAGGWHRCMSLKFEVAEVKKTLAGIFQSVTLEDIGLDPLLDLESSAGQALRSLAHAIAAGMEDEKIRSTKALALLRESMLRLVFKNFPHRCSDRLSGQRWDASPRQIRAAIDVMRARMHEPLTVGDIAEAVGISERSLQHGFRQFQGTTPVAYLRDLRLEQAHAELSLAENTLPVNEVALKWGFTHMGRFAAKYRAAYGKSPSETVRSMRGSAATSEDD